MSSALVGLRNNPTPKPLHDTGTPTQIAYYSCLPGAVKPYEYRSCKALRLYKRPDVPIKFDKNFLIFQEMCEPVDSFPRQELRPVMAACKAADRMADLGAANIITRRGVVLEYVCYPVVLPSG